MSNHRIRTTAKALLAGAALAVGLAAPQMTFGQARSAPMPVPAAPQPSSARPNIVVILLDDTGFSDIASFGGEIPTPNIDRLAAEGLRFTQFYNTPRCSPSRASLLTGLYPHEAGLGNLEAVVRPGSRGTFGKLADRAVTMAEVLHGAGYYTAMAGKWHLGITHGVGPWNRGFDHSLASAEGGIYFKDQTNPGARTLWVDGREMPSSSPEIGTDYWYSPDLFVGWGGRYIRQAEAEKKPFFLYLPFVGMHWPLKAPPDDIARFKGKYMAGWDEMRRARLAREKQLGIVTRDEKMSPPLPEAYDWSKVPADDKQRFDTMMAIYAAAMSRMDRAIGTLVEQLRASGELDNTLILLMADNGANAEGGPDGKSDGAVLGSAASRVWTGLNWAMLQNTPLAYFKHYTEEGGISSPFIAHWPAGIDPKLDGTLVRDPSHLIDIMPTVAEVAGASYPTTFHGHAILPEEGRSIVPVFHGKALTRDVPLFWEHEGNRAVRSGNWKLVSRFQEPWELYDLTSDRSETNDQARSRPDIVKQMAAQYDAWAKRAFVDPQMQKVSGGVFTGELEGGRPRDRQPIERQ